MTNLAMPPSDRGSSPSRTYVVFVAPYHGGGLFVKKFTLPKTIMVNMPKFRISLEGQLDEVNYLPEEHEIPNTMGEAINFFNTYARGDQTFPVSVAFAYEDYLNVVEITIQNS